MATPKPREKTYRVLASSIKSTDGTWCFQGAILYTSEIGDEEQIKELIAKGKIEEVTHAADGE